MSSKKICIVGFSESTRDEAPFDDPSFEFWGMNNLWKHVEALWSRWFEMHTPAFIEQHREKWPEYPDWLRNTKIPVYMLRQYPEYPSSRKYPLEEVQANLFKLNSPEVEYFSSTVAYAICMAYNEGVEELAIYGVDMIKDTEWDHQRPNCEYLIGLLRGSGIKVHVPQRSALLKAQWMYGYQEMPATKKIEQSAVKRLEYLDGEIKQMKHEVEKANGEYLVHLGAYKETQAWLTKIREAARGASLQ